MGGPESGTISTRAGRVLVTGATGGIGGHLVELLREAQVSMRALCRKEEQRHRFAERGVEAVLGDLDDEESLRRAMTDCDQLFLLTAPTEQQLEQDRRAVDAAVAVGLRRVVRISAADANLSIPVPWAKAHANADQHLLASGLKWTILRPSAFMQNLKQQAPQIRRGFLPQTSKGGKVAWIDSDDIAAVAHRVLVEPGHEGATYFLTGPEALFMPEIASILSKILDHRVRDVHLPRPVFGLALRLAGNSSWMANGLVEQFATVARNGCDVAVTGEVARLIGRPPTSLDQYLEVNRDEFCRP